jgi:Putative prokaryotic signal transducing protein
MADPVVLTTVSSELEAEIACGLLRANGIKCGTFMGDPAAGLTGDPDGGSGVFANVWTGGSVEIVVDEKDLDAARKLLADAARESEDDPPEA